MPIKRNTVINIGYVIISNTIIRDHKPVTYFYREKPDDAKDSGWRFFCGEETQEYVDEADNFAMYNASTIVEIEPAIAQYLGVSYPVAFELIDGNFIEIVEEE